MSEGLHKRKGKEEGKEVSLTGVKSLSPLWSRSRRLGTSSQDVVPLRRETLSSVESFYPDRSHFTRGRPGLHDTTPPVRLRRGDRRTVDENTTENNARWLIDSIPVVCKILTLHGLFQNNFHYWSIWFFQTHTTPWSLFWRTKSIPSSGHENKESSRREDPDVLSTLSPPSLSLLTVVDRQVVERNWYPHPPTYGNGVRSRILSDSES